MSRNRDQNWLFVGLFFILFLPSIGMAQKEGNIWYFGSLAGLDFNSGKPVALTDGKTSSYFSSVAIADARGKLRFYSNGQWIWNRNHQVMPNGKDLFGHSSCFPGGVIVPHPGDTNLFYLFTAEYQSGPHGLCYSVVDMRKQNGLGDVVQKNVKLFTPSTEKLTVVRHVNQTDYWVICHESGTNIFRSYLVNAKGIDTTPVRSPVGTIFIGGGAPKGQMTASADGRRIAIASYLGDFRVDLYDFDNGNGRLSNPLRLPVSSFDFGASFSPDNSKLYVTRVGTPSYILQYDLESGDSTEILKSMVEVARLSDKEQFGALQIGPDGRIYIARWGKKFLDVFENPNEAGSKCGYKSQAVSLESGTSFFGLPLFIPGPSYPITFFSENTCSGTVTVFSLSDSIHIDSIKWDFGDPQSGALNTSASFNPHHIYGRSDSYTVTLNYWYHGRSSIVRKKLFINPVPNVHLPNDTILCEGDSMTVDVSSFPAQDYLWNTGSTAKTITINKQGSYWVELSSGSCKATDSIRVNFIDPPHADLGRDTILCLGDFLVWDLQQPFAKYRWQDGSTNSRMVAHTPDRYHVEVSNACSTAKASVTVEFEDCTCYLYAPTGFSPNGDNMNDSFSVSPCKTNDFLLQVYNRWGERVFESTDIKTGWDGKFKGQTVQEGVYLYLAQARGQDRKWYFSKGQVTVIR